MLERIIRGLDRGASIAPIRGLGALAAALLRSRQKRRVVCHVFCATPKILESCPRQPGPIPATARANFPIGAPPSTTAREDAVTRIFRTLSLAALVLASALACRAGATHADSPAGTPVLLYHRFHPTQPGPLTVRTSNFEARLESLARGRHRVVRLHEIVARLRSGMPLDPMEVAITVDDGDPSVYSEMFPLILRYRVPVTLFICPAFISAGPKTLSWDRLAEMVRSGLVDVQAHSYDHPDLVQERRRRSPADYQSFLTRQLDQTRAVLAERLGKTVDLLAWPNGSHDPVLRRRAAQGGYVAAFGVDGRPARAGDDLFAIPRIAVLDP